MMVFLAVLVVLTMAGVAVVAAGRTGALPEEYDDRPDARVPAGRLRGDDLRRVRFSLGFRGYRMSEVDTLLARLADQLDDRPDDRLDERPAERPDDRPDEPMDEESDAPQHGGSHPD